MKSIKIAGVQMDIAFADRQKNSNAIAERFVRATQNGAQLVVFPECAMTGYCFSDIDEARIHTEPNNGPTVERFTALCAEQAAMIVYGYLESDGHQIFNSVALVGPHGLIDTYRKIHLPFLGVDRFTTPGNQPFKITKLTTDHLPELTAEIRIGMNICYDCSFPESARALTLLGADLVVLPTNWPTGAKGTADYIINARCIENHIYFMAVDRIGHERGFDFIGKSKICDPKGVDLAFADHTDEEIIYAEIVPQLARNKSTINVPGEYELHRIGDRRPEYYQSLSELGSKNETKQ